MVACVDANDNTKAQVISARAQGPISLYIPTPATNAPAFLDHQTANATCLAVLVKESMGPMGGVKGPNLQPGLRRITRSGGIP